MLNLQSIQPAAGRGAFRRSQHPGVPVVLLAAPVVVPEARAPPAVVAGVRPLVSMLAPV
jgi:hypothetical protein